MKRIALAGVAACLALVVSCAGGTSSNPASPQLAETGGRIPRLMESVPPGRTLLGLYNVSIDPATREAAVVPVRSACWHLNALKFLEVPEGGPKIWFNNIEIAGRRVEVDVTVKHPFGGFPHYCGFDIKGEVIGYADTTDPTDPSRRWAGGPNGLRVLNADGWTRWWNPVEFKDNGTIFSYRNSEYGTADSVANYNATLCGYKVFAASLNPEDGLAHMLAVPLDHPTGRAVFLASGIETRHYELLFPDDGEGGPDLVFSYAVDACHGFPPGYVPGQYIEVPGGFPPDANQLEPFIVDVQIPTNTVYLSEEGCVGGSLELLIRVSDWQALLAGTSISEQVQSIELTSPTLFMGTRVPELTSAGTPDKPWATYRILLEGLSPDSFNDQQVLVTVVSSEGDYQPYVTSYDGTAPLSSFYLVHVPVSQTAPIGGRGFALNPLSPWPKPGGTMYNSNTSRAVGPVDPKVAWEVTDLTTDAMPVVDAEGRTFVAREIANGGLDLNVLDAGGYPLMYLSFPNFKFAGDPMLIGCSVLWNDSSGGVYRLYQDGSHEHVFTPDDSDEYKAYGMMAIDEDGHAFVHGPSSIQAFNEYGSLLWARYAVDGVPSLFIGPITITSEGLVVVGLVEVAGGPPGDFEFWALQPETGKIEWVHSPEVTGVIANGAAADPLTGQIYYAITNRIVALNADGEQKWYHLGGNYFLPSLAIAPDGTIYAAEGVLGSGSPGIVALTPQGSTEWKYGSQNGISAGPITDSTGRVYFATEDGIVRCLDPDGSLEWERPLGCRPSYLVFGPDHSILVGARETLFKMRLICLKD